MTKRSASPPEIVPGAYVAPKRARQLEAPRAPTLDSWLKPNVPRPLLAASPQLHASSSTFVSFTYAFEPPLHVRSVAALEREARRVVRELDVVQLIGPELLARGEGAFADGGGRAPGARGRERAREPDHRMWAVRALGLVEGKDGTGGEGDYQLLEASDDDGEKYGGARVLRVLAEQGGVDVLTICCRWFGGDLLGPARFHHIGVTAQHSLTELQRLTELRDLRSELVRLDGEIAAMREILAATTAPGTEAGVTAGAPSGTEGTSTTTSTGERTGSGVSAGTTVHAPAASGDSTPTAVLTQTPLTTAKQPTYDDIEDVPRLERLVKAKERTRANLGKRLGPAGVEQAERTAATAAAGAGGAGTAVAAGTA